MANPPEILVIDDDTLALAQTRRLIEEANFGVRTAEDGLQGLASVMMRAPDLILADAQMPKMDGFGLLRAIRANERTRAIPFFVMVSEAEASRASEARADGADLVLTKPLARDRLLGAIGDYLKQKAPRNNQTMAGLRFKTGSNIPIPIETPKLEQHTLPANFAQFVEEAPNTLIGESILDPDVELQASQLISKRNTTGTVLFSDIRNFTSISEKLESEEVVEMLNAYFARACEPIQRQHGWVVKFLGDGLVALFESPPGHMQDHAERAIKAGLLMVLAAVRFRAWIAERHPQRNLPEFAVGVGIHTGEVTVCKMGGAETPETTIIGDTVNTAARLEEKTKEVGWSCIASAAAFDSGGARILAGGRDRLTVKGRVQPVEIVDVVGLHPKATATEHERKFYDAVSSAVASNSRTLRANAVARAALANAGASAFPAGTSRPGEIRIPGYRMVRKLGEGGMSPVWLARRESDNAEVVLKLLPITGDDRKGDRLQRFIQEYALVSQIDHPNVAKIYEQGFTDAYAYIAMEYFPGGDLRGLTKGGLKPDVAQAVLIQIAGALAAIHSRGIIHRDMKPDNVMLRNDGSLGLADFGIAKHADSNFSHTRHGEVFGTPYYLSPEQALGQPVERRSDIYSLGVMLYEMLTGKKPYYADSAQALLYQHVHAPVPTLPASLVRFQSLLSRMMAKRPQDRFSSAEEIIDAVIPL